MMMNLFSMFDPSTMIYSYSLNWLSVFLGIFLVPMIFWFFPNNMMIIYQKILFLLFNEYKMFMKSSDKTSILLFISLFIFFVMSNFIGLFPYIFTSTSHLILNLTLALPMWFSFMLSGWLLKTNQMFIHLVPQGTPLGLIPFMVLIESISNLIRPFTLMIRLTANMIAGHLLLSLLGGLGAQINTLLLPFLLLIQILLLILESAVAIIQAYVFSVLMALYYSEI